MQPEQLGQDDQKNIPYDIMSCSAIKLEEVSLPRFAVVQELAGQLLAGGE